MVSTGAYNTLQEALLLEQAAPVSTEDIHMRIDIQKEISRSKPIDQSSPKERIREEENETDSVDVKLIVSLTE